MLIQLTSVNSVTTYYYIQYCRCFRNITHVIAKTVCVEICRAGGWHDDRCPTYFWEWCKSALTCVCWQVLGEHLKRNCVPILNFSNYSLAWKRNPSMTILGRRWPWLVSLILKQQYFKSNSFASFFFVFLLHFLCVLSPFLPLLSHLFLLLPLPSCTIFPSLPHFLLPFSFPTFPLFFFPTACLTQVPKSAKVHVGANPSGRFLCPLVTVHNVFSYPGIPSGLKDTFLAFEVSYMSSS